jgi:hypothetical protein
MSVPSQGSERAFICVLAVLILALSTIFLLDFGTGPTMLFLVFHFITVTTTCDF